MKEVKLGKHQVMLYNSIDELPIVRFHRYNKMLLVDAGIGSDISDFDQHIERAMRFFRKGDAKNGTQELDNMRQCVYMIMQEQGIKDLSFACLIKEIDGKACDDISDDGLNATLHLLGGVTRQEITEALDSVKKKIDEELTLFFPDIFDDTSEKEFYDLMKKRTVARLQNIIDGEDAERNAEIERLTEQMILFAKPKTFNGSESVEIKQDKDFESLCLTIQKETTADVKRMNTMEFYQAYEYVLKMLKTQNKAVSKRR